MITTLLTDDLAPSVSFPPSPPPLTTSHRSVLQIPAQGGQGVGRHQDRPRLRPGEREDRADAGPASRDVVRYTCEQSLHLAIIMRCQCLETCYLMANNFEKLGR